MVSKFCYLPSIRSFGSCQNASIFYLYVHFVARPRRFPGRCSASVVPAPMRGGDQRQLFFLVTVMCNASRRPGQSVLGLVTPRICGAGRASSATILFTLHVCILAHQLSGPRCEVASSSTQSSSSQVMPPRPGTLRVAPDR
jgi:hypothetical protein